jgi:hypothetical protein
MGQLTLRISIQENDNTIGFTLVGRLAGPWVEELDRAWRDVMSRLEGKRLSLDVRDLTYSDADGKRVLRDMFSRNRAEFITHSDWSQNLADEIRNTNGTYTNGRP